MSSIPIETKMVSSSSFDNELYADEFYFSALYDTDEILPISDERYAEELTLQEALFSSSAAANVVPSTSTTAHQVTNVPTETGESSSSRNFFCTICMDDDILPEEIFQNRGNCKHTFCNQCIGKYLATKIQESVVTIECPDIKCRTILEVEVCQQIVPKEVFERWENAICEAMVIGSEKFYCPFKDCSAMMIDDSGVTITVSECPYCRRLFCAQCKVAWHAGYECSEFDKIKDAASSEREDRMAIDLAKNMAWTRCRKCQFFVEKKEGCQHITCRCGYEFCYSCGATWDASHACL